MHALGRVFKEEVCGQGDNAYFELFGLDLLIDYQLGVHLLEINLSARCEERH